MSETPPPVDNTNPGNDCKWYHTASGCDRAAKARCPVACKVVFYCATPEPVATSLISRMMVPSLGS